MTTTPATLTAQRNDLTTDCVPIVPGLRVWTNNLDADEVLSFAFEENGSGWYNCRSGLFNGERMATRHPITGALA